MLPIATTSCTITYRPDLHLLIVRWHQDAQSTVLQADYQAVLAAALEHGCARWLLDVRRREQYAPQLEEWAGATFYPTAATQLAPQPLRLAVLASSYIYERALADPQQREHVRYLLADERPFTTNVFMDEALATQWLQSQ
jgi:hypothetical protein